MYLFNFIVWLSAGAVVGWFASRMVRSQRDHQRKIHPGEGHKPKNT